MATAELEPLAVLERPTGEYGEIPRANILPAGREFPDDAWLNVPNVPVFAEHQTTTKGGRHLVFDRRALQQLAEACNRRIRQTGDYAGIVVGHTPDPETAGHTPPMPLVGLAGPFRMGLLRQQGGEPKWAILADFHIQRSQADVVRQYPRRSAELWVEDSYDQMHLDPIALLGAEAPRLDMGLLYSAVCRRDGREVEKYSAAAPSATSVYVPEYSAASPQAGDAADRDPTHSPENNKMAFSPEDVKQIVDALEQLDWVQWVKSQMQGAEPPPAEPPPLEGETPPAEPPPAEPPPAETPPAEPPPPAENDQNLPLRYSRLSGELTTLRQTVDTLRTQLEDQRERRVNTERYSALADCRRTRLFDLDGEFELVRYGRMSDEQFTAHLERINTNYREIPLDTTLPAPDLPAALSPTRPGGAKAKERYSREVADKAMNIAKRKAMRGEPVSYEEVLEQVASGAEE